MNQFMRKKVTKTKKPKFPKGTLEYSDGSFKKIKVKYTSYGHEGDCTIYASMINLNVTDGICTCGYGWRLVRLGDDSQMFSKERLTTSRSR